LLDRKNTIVLILITESNQMLKNNRKISSSKGY